MFVKGITKYNCTICNKIFTPSTVLSKYCSKKCYNYAANKAKKIKVKKNPEKYRKLWLEHYYKDHEHSLKIRRKNSRINRKNILVRLAINLRTRFKHALKSMNIKKENSIIKILGCSRKEYKKYLEEKFTDGMSWDNFGKDGWCIDHIIPLAKANNKEELYKLCHYTNTQPLWFIDNLIKGNKYENKIHRYKK